MGKLCVSLIPLVLRPRNDWLICDETNIEKVIVTCL